MSRIAKRTGILVGIIAVIVLAPVIWSAWGTHGYFDCGIWREPGYYYFHNNTLCELTPEGGDWGRPVYLLRQTNDGWEARSVAMTVTPEVNWAFLMMTNDTRAVLQLKLQGGDLYELWGTNWTRFPRVYNIWKVWFQEYLSTPAEKEAQHISCVNNLKQIGLAFRIWAGDNGDQFPCNVSTNAGGTRELCRTGTDGFDVNTFRHFQTLSNELATPILLVCPKDKTKRVATNWSSVGAENVSYRLRFGPSLSDNHPNEVLAVCPVDGNILYCDGHVTDKNGKPAK